MSSSSSVPLLGVVVCALAGCASVPITGAQSTGEALRVVETSQTFNVTSQVKVGEVKHRDRTGRLVGTSEITENRTRQVTEYDWHLMQGLKVTDESDYYRIAGDLERSNLVDEKRRGAVTLQTLGVICIPIGIAIAAAGILLAFIPLQTVMDLDTGMTTKEPVLPSIFGTVMVGAGGAFAGGLGGLLINMGNQILKPGNKLLPREEAEAAAEQYNATLR